ncbi:hypothetical protein [Kordiimonas sp.]|uniref:hypothetical protein n=1 Tax=Kordiimonas sp. TaxID=1970157 RepID=UPI003A8FE071
MDETELAIRNTEIQQNHALTVYQSKIDLAKVASGIGLFFVKSLILINGGAIVALLGLLGGVGGPAGLAAKLAHPTITLIAGIVAGMSSAGAAFIGQGLYVHDQYNWGNLCAALSYIFGVVSLAAFASGAYNAVTAIAEFSSVS